MKNGSKRLLKRTLSIVLTCMMVLSMLPGTAFAAKADAWDTPVAEIPAENETAAKDAENPAQPLETIADRTTPQTYYVSTSGKGGNTGLSQDSPLPGLDAVPWDQLIAGDRVLLNKGDTFPGAIRMVDRHGTSANPITIDTYGEGNAPVIEARGQGIWLPKEGNKTDGTPGKYVSSGITLYDCSYITVTGLNIVNVPDTMKTSFTDKSGASDVDGVSDHSGEKMAYSGIGVATSTAKAAEGITLTDITVRGDSSVVNVKTDQITGVVTTGVTTGAAATARTYKDSGATTYYVSSKRGSDSNNGTSESTPFYSLHKINELKLQPGAKVYLERGSVFENQYLHLQGGGAEGNPVIIDAYGTGNAPVINTNGNGVWYQNYRKNLDDGRHLRHGYVSSSILIYDVEYIEVKNIAMTNFGRYGETRGADFENLGSMDGGTVPGETGYSENGNIVGTYSWGGKMSRSGVAGVSQNVGTMDHIYLQNLDIENVYGNVIYKHMDNGGIYFTVAAALDETTTGIPKINDLRIEGCYLKRVSRWGIAAAYTGAYCNAFGGTAISDETCQKYGVTNLYIGHNYLEEVGGDPITTMYAYEPLVEYNVSQKGGREMSGSGYMNSTPYHGNPGSVSAGIWPWKCKTALFEHNECYTMLYSNRRGGNNDAQAWDADSGDSTIYQYNYSSGNTGGCIMFCAGAAYNSVFRYNVSYQDGVPAAQNQNSTNRGILDFSSSPNGQVYNNTFIMAEGTPIYHYKTDRPTKVDNNIFFNLGNPYTPIEAWNACSGARFQSNIYVDFETHPTDDTAAVTDLEKTDLFTDPAFAGAPTGPKSDSKTGVRTTADGIRDWTHDWATEFNMFKTKSTATKAINAGMPHNYDCLTQDSNFGVPRAKNETDFYGNALDNFHDIGAFDTQTADPQGVTVTSVSHDRATIQWSAVANAASYKVALDGGEPVAAEGLSYHIFADLFPLAEYTVSVTAYDANGQALGVARTATFTTTRPAAPANPDAIRPVAIKAGNQASGNEATKAIDGLTGTTWHTTWGGDGASNSNAADRWIAVDLGSVRTIENFKYLPRQDTSGDGKDNGSITQYEIYVSSTDSDWQNPGNAGSWTKAKEGAWTTEKVWKTVNFNANTTARYVKLKCVAGVNNFASAAEIAVNGVSCMSVALENATVALNKTLTVAVTPTPADAPTSSLVWTSSNRKVATVDGNGVVTPLSVGTTTITAHLLNNTTATCTVTVIPRELSDACELVTSLFEVRDTDKLQVPFTEKNPTTVAELKAALTVSEAATVKVLNGAAEQADTANVAAGMTVRIVAENGTSHTDYTVAQKNTYNSNTDWLNNTQGNVWFYQYDNGTQFVNHTSWDGQWDAWGGSGPKFQSVERNQACGSIAQPSAGSGFTFRAPADGAVQLRLFCYDGTTLLGEDKVRMRQQNNGNTLDHYIRIYLNGEELEGKEISLQNDTNLVDATPTTIALAQGDTLSVMAWNGGDFSNNGGNNGIFFNPVITYLNETYVPDPKSITLNESEVNLSSNDSANKTVQLSATILPAEASHAVTWSVRDGDESVVSVSDNGLVTAVGNGTAVVYAHIARSWGTPLEATCTVHVTTRVTGITVKTEDGAEVGTTPIKVYANAALADHPHSVTLTAEVTPATASNKMLSWTRPEGAKGMLEITRAQDGLSATLTATTNELNVGEVKVEVASEANPEVTQLITLHVIRALENNVYVTGEAKVGSTLTASTVDLVMKDAAKEKLKYQWYRGAVSEENKIEGANKKQYVVTENDIGATLYVTVTADPATFYEGTRSAAAAQAVAKMDGPAAPEGLTAVQCTEGSTGGKITNLDGTKAYEYSTDGERWTRIDANSTEITLPAGTYQVRIAATDTQEAGAAVTKTILPANATGYDITFDVAEGGRVDVDKNPATERDTVTITVTAEPGYRLVDGSLTVAHTDNDQQTVDVTEQNTFEMPAANVTISATFEKLTFTITHDMENVTCSLSGEHTHTVEYGDQPAITLNADKGYTMPANVTVTVTGSDTVFHGYTYSHKADTPDTATLTFTQGITENLTISGTAPLKTYAVNYTVKNGVTAPETNAPRSVQHGAAYTGKLVEAAGYRLPLGITVTMDGEPFPHFAYDSSTGVITIAEGKIAGNLVITASGVDASEPVVPVTAVELSQSDATLEKGKTLRLVAKVTPENATDPSVTWRSTDSAVASVDEEGVVTGEAVGTAIIIVTTVDGRRVATCTVNVREPSKPSGGNNSSTSTSTIIETKDDGTKVTTVTKPDGTKTETTETPDGTVAVVETKPDGSKTQTVEQPDGTKSELAATKDGDVTITVTDKDGEELVKTEIPATIPEPETKFVDLAPTPWADEAIHKMAGLELVEGTGDNKYSPVASMTRGSLATVLHRLSQGKTDYEITFKDVAETKFYAPGVAWAAKAGVVTGYTADTFAPEDIITREQLAVMLARYAKLIGMNTKADSAALAKFNDGENTGSWAVDGMAWCVENGIIRGKDGNRLDPTTDVSRAEVAVMLDRFIELLK